MESPIDRVVPLETSNFCPRVTVFVPVYNAEKFIADTVASVLRQTFTDFELLVIDDGSTDQSIKILESFHDQRIRIERNGKNRGRPFTRNKGLMQARGEYLSVLDSDDLCEPDRLARQVEFLDTHPNIAAVGSRTAFAHYKVPITAKNIQNKPNITSFFLIGSKKPAAQQTDHVLICLPKATERTKTAINQAVTDAGCSVSSNWNLRWDNTEAYFAEVDGTFDKLNLQSCVLAIQEQFKSAFVVGGYKNKCITSLIFAE